MDLLKWLWRYCIIFAVFIITHFKSETNLSIQQTVYYKGICEKHSGNIPFFKLVSFLQLPVYPSQMPKPPSVKLTNEAIKFRVSNSFELHLLSESFNIPTVGSQSSSGLFSTLGSLFNRDHQLALYSVIHFLREREGNEHFSEWNNSCVCDSSIGEKFPMCFQKRD